MSTIYLIHGFNVTDGGKGTTGSLKNGLENAGHTVREIKYGWMGRIRVRLCNNGLAKALADMAEEDSIVVAHSNGCAIAYKAALYGAPFKQVFLINPALDADKEVPNVRKVHVFHALSDPWARLAKWIPYSIWGNQGQVGFTGEAEEGKYKQTELDSLAGKAVGHSGIFGNWLLRAKLLKIITGEINGQ